MLTGNNNSTVSQLIIAISLAMYYAGSGKLFQAVYPSHDLQNLRYLVSISGVQR